MSRLPLRFQNEFKGPFVTTGETVFRWLANDHIIRLNAQPVGRFGANTVQLLTHDEKESQSFSPFIPEPLERNDHRPQDTFGITGTPTIDEAIVLAAGIKGGYGVEVSTKYHPRRTDAPRENIEALPLDFLELRVKAAFTDMALYETSQITFLTRYRWDINESANKRKKRSHFNQTQNEAVATANQIPLAGKSEWEGSLSTRLLFLL
jgi:hypothetical protein